MLAACSLRSMPLKKKNDTQLTSQRVRAGMTCRGIASANPPWIKNKSVLLLELQQLHLLGKLDICKDAERGSVLQSNCASH